MPKQIAPEPRVESKAIAPEPRVEKTIPTSNTLVPTAKLQIHSKELKNARFNNIATHNYALRSRSKSQQHNLQPALYSWGTNFKHQAVQYLVTQHKI